MSACWQDGRFFAENETWVVDSCTRCTCKVRPAARASRRVWGAEGPQRPPCSARKEGKARGARGRPTSPVAAGRGQSSRRPSGCVRPPRLRRDTWGGRARPQPGPWVAQVLPVLVTVPTDSAQPSHSTGHPAILSARRSLRGRGSGSRDGGCGPGAWRPLCLREGHRHTSLRGHSNALLSSQKFKTVCHQISCPPATCANPLLLEGDCCPSCVPCECGRPAFPSGCGSGRVLEDAAPAVRPRGPGSASACQALSRDRGLRPGLTGWLPSQRRTARRAGPRGPSGPSAPPPVGPAPSRGGGPATSPATPARGPPSRRGPAAWASATTAVSRGAGLPEGGPQARVPADAHASVC